MKTPRERQVFARAGQALALEPSAFMLDYESGAKEVNEDECGPIGLLNIDGPLSFKMGWWFDSYEAITYRFAQLMADPNVKVIVMNINSPGGEAAGNAETVKAMRAMKTKPVIAVANEAAYSAAYALACVADEIYLPEAAGVGSVGVIAGMCDVTEMNKKDGVRVELITSGARKADGNPNIPISDEAIASLQERVDQLAGIFFDLVAESRGMSTEDVKALQAGCFYGDTAVQKGLADGVMSFDEVLALAGDEYATGDNMAKLIDKKAASAPAAKATKKAMKVSAVAAAASSEEEDPEEDGGTSEDMAEGDGDDKDAPPPADSSGDVSQSDDEDGEEEPSEEDDESDAEQSLSDADVLAAVRTITGSSDRAAQVGLLHALASSHRKVGKLEAKLAKTKKVSKADAINAMVADGIKAGKIEPARKDEYIHLGMTSKAALETFLKNTGAKVVKVSTSREATPSTPDAPAQGTTELTEADLKLAALTPGVTADQLKAKKAQLIAQGFKLH